MAVVKFAALYGRPVPPMRAESLPPMRTLNGEKYVADPPPDGARSGVASVYWNVLAEGTAVIVNVPL